VVLTIDELASAAGTTTRTIRSFQTRGLIDPPELRGRTGLYGTHHLQRLLAVLRLQESGFSLQSLAALFAAHERGDSLEAVLGLADRFASGTSAAATSVVTEPDAAELYAFSQLQGGEGRRRATRRRPLLAVVPTTMWEAGQMEAS